MNYPGPAQRKSLKPDEDENLETGLTDPLPMVTNQNCRVALQNNRNKNRNLRNSYKPDGKSTLEADMETLVNQDLGDAKTRTCICCTETKRLSRNFPQEKTHGQLRICFDCLEAGIVNNHRNH